MSYASLWKVALHCLWDNVMAVFGTLRIVGGLRLFVQDSDWIQLLASWVYSEHFWSIRIQVELFGTLEMTWRSFEVWGCAVILWLTCGTFSWEVRVWIAARADNCFAILATSVPLANSAVMSTLIVHCEKIWRRLRGLATCCELRG